MHNFYSDKIKSKAKDFSLYVNNQLFNTKEEKKLIKGLLAQGDVWIFGGIIRDFFFSESQACLNHRDIDLVVSNLSESNIKFISNYLIRKTLFGGYKLNINKKNYDIWELENTWALKEFPLSFKEDKNPLPDTSFFNITAIVFSLKTQEFILNKKFVKSLRKNQLDIVFEHNPFPSLCIVKTFEYVNKYNLCLSNSLKKYLKNEFESAKGDFETIQIKHFGDVLYSQIDIEDFCRTIFDKKRYKDKALDKITNTFFYRYWRA